jgi:4-hydroxy-tetrahydrodipicolinate reductase
MADDGRVLILGAGGRMGAALTRCLAKGAAPGLTLAAGVDAAEHPALGQDLGVLAGVPPVGVALRDAWEADGADVAVEFSTPDATVRHAALLAAQGIPVVIGTTGLSAAQREAVDLAAARIPVVLAPNMSLGVNLLLSLVEQTATALRDKGYDIEILERHHRLKRDAPSGTALSLGEAAARGIGVRLEEAARHGRHGLPGERTDREIGFHAVRGGDLIGDHTVLFAAGGECIELSHRATSRDTFAVGALQAAAWLRGRPPGRYGMNDVLGL